MDSLNILVSRCSITNVPFLIRITAYRILILAAATTNGEAFAHSGAGSTNAAAAAAAAAYPASLQAYAGRLSAISNEPTGLSMLPYNWTQLAARCHPAPPDRVNREQLCRENPLIRCRTYRNSQLIVSCRGSKQCLGFGFFFSLSCGLWTSVSTNNRRSTRHVVSTSAKRRLVSGPRHDV